MKELLSICIIIVGFLFAAGCIDYPDIVPELPSDSVPAPTDSIPGSIESTPTPTDSIPVPTDSIPVPTDSVPVSTPDNRSGTPDFFIIYNWDSNNSHEVAIEIINSDNESIFKELYIIDQNEIINYLKTAMITKPDSRLYTFKVVLDNETTDMIETGIDPWTTLTIFLYHKSPDYGTSGEIIPLEIFVVDE